MRRVIPALLALLLFIALAAPAAAKDKKPAPSTTTTTTTTTTWPPLPAFDTTLVWSDCGDGFQCATLTVPVDWAKPTGEQMGIALTRLPAAPDQRIGSLVFNYGGPGSSGIEHLPPPGGSRRPCATASTS